MKQSGCMNSQVACRLELKQSCPGDRGPAKTFSYFHLDHKYGYFDTLKITPISTINMP